MKFKGVFRPTVIRKPIGENGQEAGDKTVSQPSMDDILPEIKTLKINKPDYSIKYRNPTDLQDHVVKQQSHVTSVRPKEMVIDINLPLLDSAAGVDLDVQERSLTVVREEPPKYNLHVDLQYPVDEERGSAKFDKSKKTLVVTLPIKPGPQLIAERLGSNDSGIEEDTAYRTKQSDDMITEVNDKVDNHEDGDDNKPLDPEEDNRTESNVSVPDDFLDANISYMYPSFTCSVQNNVITLTLEVKNVSPDSFTKKLFSDPQAMAFKFSSIGSGYVPFHHAFAIQFLAPGSFDEDQLEVDFWD